MEGGEMTDRKFSLTSIRQRFAVLVSSSRRGSESEGGAPCAPLWYLIVFIAGLLLAYCLCTAAANMIMPRALTARLSLAQDIAKRPPSFASAKLESGLGGLAELNPFGADTPKAASGDAAESGYPVSSLMLAGTLPRVGAWIRDDSGTHLVLKNQDIQGYRLEDVSYGRALLSKNGESYPLYLMLSGGTTVAPPPPPAAGGKPGAQPDFTKIDPARDGKEGSVPRELVDKLIMNPYDEMAKMRMTPAEGGGMRLERIDPTSVLGVVGVTQGDVIKAINGVNITNMGDAANAMNSLMSGSRFDVTVDREGKPLELKYQVK
jgi:type II secretory pathway component PulC